MVGYQGLSSRSSSQRQSGAYGKATHTGTPRRPRTVSDGCIDGNEQVQILQDSRRVREILEVAAKISDGKRG